MLTFTTISAAIASLLVVVTLSPLCFPPNYHFLFLSLASNSSAAFHLHSLTQRPHSSSTPADSLAADYVSFTLSYSFVATRSTFYDVLLSFPLRRSLALTTAADDLITFSLTQDPAPGDPSSAYYSSEILPTFLAYSASAAAAAPAVYANYGRVEDFLRLEEMGVRVNGSVAVARYGKIFRGDIVKNAQDAGAAAAVLFTDAKDYGGDGVLFPEGRGMPRSGVQVGSTFLGVGDPTTPGWASSRYGGVGERVGEEEARRKGLMVGIPAIPVSARDAEVIMGEVGGDVADEDWQGVDGGVVYRVGPGPGVLNVSYVGDDRIATIRNVIGVIRGEEEPDR